MTSPVNDLQRPPRARILRIARRRRGPSSRLSAVLSLPLLGVLLIVIGGCALPTLDNRTTSSALPADEAHKTALGLAIAPLVETIDSGAS